MVNFKSLCISSLVIVFIVFYLISVVVMNCPKLVEEEGRQEKGEGPPPESSEEGSITGTGANAHQGCLGATLPQCGPKNKSEADLRSVMFHYHFVIRWGKRACQVHTGFKRL